MIPTVQLSLPHDHLGSGKSGIWTENDGLFIFPPYLSEYGTGWYKGSADAMYANLTFLKRSNEELVPINQGYAIYNMNYAEMLGQHVDKDGYHHLAGRWMICWGMPGIVGTGSDQKIIDQEKPLNPKATFASWNLPH